MKSRDESAGETVAIDATLYYLRLFVVSSQSNDYITDHKPDTVPLFFAIIPLLTKRQCASFSVVDLQVTEGVKVRNLIYGERI